MNDIEFIYYAASNYMYIVLYMLIFSSVIYGLTCRIAPAGYLDPFHFYFTFTFGTAYGVITSLFVDGYIQPRLYLLVMLYGLLFIIFFSLFSHLKHNITKNIIYSLLIPSGRNPIIEASLAFLIYIAVVIVILKNVGFGFLAETNRFEQNRGFGLFVRIADSLRVFIVAYSTILLANKIRRTGWYKPSTVIHLLFLVFIMISSSLLNGSKFSLLECIYAAILGLISFGIKLRFGLIKIFSLFAISLIFSIFVLTKNLEQSGFNTHSESRYFDGMNAVSERFFLRVLGNANKYYLSLPNEVIDNLEIDSVAIRFLAPLIGSTRLSSMLGYEVGDYGLGRLTILYWYPNYDVHGGPTSHFDLAAYKYFGVFFGGIFVIFIAWILSLIRYTLYFSNGNIYMSAIVTSFWLRGLPILLEPTVGFAYVLDVFIIFFLINTIGLLIKKSIPKGQPIRE